LEQMKLLSVTDLRVFYQKVEALKGISFDVSKGSIITLLGSNGAGKSTVLRAVSGLIRPSSGEIRFKGERVDCRSPDSIVRMGISQVPEARRIFPDMTVSENLGLGAYLRRDKVQIKRDFEWVFQHFPALKERQRQAAGSMSGGEQQMLAIGRALLSGPELLLLDEPSLGLSPLMSMEIAKIIITINQGGVTVVLVEQNARLALKHAQYGYVLENGKIVLSAVAEALMEDEGVKKAYLGG